MVAFNALSYASVVCVWFWFFYVYVCAIPLLSLFCCTSICGLLWALPTPNTSCHMQLRMLAAQLATHVPPCCTEFFFTDAVMQGYFTRLQE